LRKTALSFINGPVPDPKDPTHYLGPTNTAKHIIKNQLSHNDLKAFLPLMKDSSEAATKLATDMKDDRKVKKQLFKGSKVRGVKHCDECDAPRVIYSLYEKGSTKGKGPKRRHMDKLDHFLEKGRYVCGNNIPISIFRALHAIRCYDPVESQYYCAGSSRGNRVITETICCLCYTSDDIAPPEEVKKRQKKAVKKLLPCCRRCLLLNIKLPGGGTDHMQRNMQKKAKKRAQSLEAIAYL